MLGREENLIILRGRPANEELVDRTGSPRTNKISVCGGSEGGRDMDSDMTVISYVALGKRLFGFHSEAVKYR